MTTPRLADIATAMWHAGELKSAWQPLDHVEENEFEKKDWYGPVRRYLADTLQEDGAMVNSIYENVIIWSALAYRPFSKNVSYD